jgi:death-on-curing protein
VNSRNSPDWIWLELEAVLAIHDEQIAEHGGSLGVRDPGLLEAALARPMNLAAYEQPDAAELAAVYAIAIARNHPFIDGNKRTAYVALELFLDQNAFDFGATDADATVMTWQMAAGDVSDPDFIAWVRRPARPRP